MKKLFLFSVVLCFMSLACLASSLAVVTPTAIPQTKTKPAPMATKTEASGIWTSTIVRPLVNVRKSPNGPVVDTLRTGAEVEIVKCIDDWCQIVDPPGWVWRGCLSDNPSRLGCTAK